MSIKESTKTKLLLKKLVVRSFPFLAKGRRAFALGCLACRFFYSPPSGCFFQLGQLQEEGRFAAFCSPLDTFSRSGLVLYGYQLARFNDSRALLSHNAQARYVSLF